MCNERVAAWCACVHDEHVCSGAAGEAALKGRPGCALGPAQFRTSAQAAGTGSEERHNATTPRPPERNGPVYKSARFPQTSLSSPVPTGKVPRQGHGVMRRDAFTGLLTGSTDGLLRMVQMVTHTQRDWF